MLSPQSQTFSFQIWLAWVAVHAKPCGGITYASRPFGRNLTCRNNAVSISTILRGKLCVTASATNKRADSDDATGAAVSAPVLALCKPWISVDWVPGPRHIFNCAIFQRESLFTFRDVYPFNHIMTMIELLSSTILLFQPIESGPLMSSW